VVKAYFPRDLETAAMIVERLSVQNKRDPRKPTDAKFGKLVTATQNRLHAICERLALGEIDATTFGGLMRQELRDAHVSAVVMGRNLAGDFAEPELDDKLFAELVMQEQDQYLRRFVSDIAAGRYTDAEEQVLKLAQVQQRAGYYASRIRGTANDVFVLASGPGEMFAWHQLTIEPCEDCPRLEAGGPYRGDLLPTKPGMGRTQCRTNCGCVLVRLSDGLIGFSRSYA
jgi:hypothetical protein